MASTLPRARTYLGYPAFIFVRHPQLRPENDPYTREFDESIGLLWMKLRRLGFAKQIAKMQHKREVAALVLDSVDRLERWKFNRPSLRRMKKMVQLGPSKIRKVTHKIDRARVLLAASQKDLKDADLFEVKRVRQALKDALDVLAGAKFPPRGETVTSYTTRMVGWYDESVADSFEATDPTPDIAHMLVSYLQCVCRLPPPQSRLVTMRIGNAHWDWDYHATKNDYDQEDCDALRMMVLRHR